MDFGSYQIFDGKIILRVRDQLCDQPDELLTSNLFLAILKRYIDELMQQRSKLLGVFGKTDVQADDIKLLVQTLQYLVKLPGDDVQKIVAGSDVFFKDRSLFHEFIEQLYNYWRRLHRLIICDSVGNRFDQRPYRTFNDTVETLMHVVRSTYRELQESISGNHPRIYRQVSAGAEIAAIALPKNIPYPSDIYRKLNTISIIRQVLIYPPMIFNSPTNKRTGEFQRVHQNPLEQVNPKKQEWICYPAKVGDLVIFIYFSIRYFELGFSLCNLFELANDEDINRRPDAIYLFGTDEVISSSSGSKTIFYDDAENDMLVATVPYRDEFGYFGYLKKMVLTLHNIKMMKKGRLPFHGALVNIALRGKGAYTVLLMGDSGAGKSETLEALRLLGREEIEDITIIADDMGSLEIGSDGRIIGYGTEMGAFVRLDDLQSGYALGQIDRTIIMNPDQVNARVVLPITRFEEVIKGYPLDFIFYANNYEEIDGTHPVIQKFTSAQEALEVFRNGSVMSKGTTTATGLIQTYFANIFGPAQYRSLHEGLAVRFFDAFFRNGYYVGEMRTRLAIQGMERKGPEISARELLKVLGKAHRSSGNK